MSELLTVEQRSQVKARIEELWRAVLRPPEDIPVHEWLAKNVYLPPGISPYPGWFRPETAPYLIEILGTLKDPDVRTITLAFATQSGKTLLLCCVILWTVGQDPSPVIFAIATEQQSKGVSRDRFDPIVESSPFFRSLKREGRHDYTVKTKRFKTATVNFAGGQSVREACSRPTKLLILDECDKFKGSTDEEASVFDQFRERVKAWQGHKIFQSSSPTVESGEIWKQFLDGDQSYFFVPCPHCGTKQRLIFSEIIDGEKVYRLKWAPEAKVEGVWNVEQAAKSAFYECCHCHEKIFDHHKPDMLARGEWIATHPERKHHRSFHLSSLYPVWVTFADVVRNFLKKKQYIDDLRQFRSDWLGEPWEWQTRAQGQSELMKKCGSYLPGTVPEQPIAIFLTCDVKITPIHYVVRAWCYGETSYLLGYGTVPDLDDVPLLAQTVYDGHRISKVFIDYGFQSRRVEDLCQKHGFIPIKGFARLSQDKLFDWGRTSELKLPLLDINTVALKDAFFAKLSQENGPLGSWYLPQETGTFRLGEYLHHLTSETPVVIQNKKGRDKRDYQKLHSENHLFDCEIYSFAAAIAFNVKLLPKPQGRTTQQNPPEQKPTVQPPKRVEAAPPRTHFDLLKKYQRPY